MRRGITIIETLIVIFIIAILVQLLIPAVQASRAAARKSQCMNHLKQLGVGAQLHLAAHKFLPTGGWSGAYTADPNRGYGREQPGGWAYSLLAYIEEGALREAGKGESMTAETLGPGLKLLHESAPAVLYCPERRTARPYPPVSSGEAVWGLVVAKAAQDLPGVTKSDYAANSGDALHHAASSFDAKMLMPPRKLVRRIAYLTDRPTARPNAITIAQFFLLNAQVVRQLLDREAPPHYKLTWYGPAWSDEGWVPWLFAA